MIMFTGIVEERGRVVDLQVSDEGAGTAGAARLTVRGPTVSSDAAHGDSIAVSGVWLTVIDVTDTQDGAEFGIGIIPETRTATTIGSAPLGATVNLEVDVIAKYVERLLAVREREQA